MEHTGIYNNHLLVYLHKKKANVCLESASQIKNSMGNVRGKNDKVDAIRIAEYACRNGDRLKLWEPRREVIQGLAQLSSVRSRLIEAKKILQVPLKENKAFISKSLSNQSAKVCSNTLKAIMEDLQKADSELDEVINSDAELKRLFGLITSVDGVGKMTAVQVLVTTNEFIDINEPKKFACYSGVAPFTKESGLFKGKARISHLANKKIKTLLHLSAMAAIQYNQELKAFYKRKVEQEKKNKMSVINAVRNKLILRIFSCVNQNKKYEKTYTHSLA